MTIADKYWSETYREWAAVVKREDLDAIRARLGDIGASVDDRAALLRRLDRWSVSFSAPDSSTVEIVELLKSFGLEEMP